MSETDSQRVSCPGCNKGYRWDLGLVGQTVACRKCGASFAVPSEPGTVGERLDAAVTDDGTYELDLDAETPHPDEPEPMAVPAQDGKCPACNNKISETAVICLNCGFNLKQGKRIETAVVAAPAEADDVATAQPTTTPAVGYQTPQDHSTALVARREAVRDEAEAEMAAKHRWTEINLPLILLGVGLVLLLINAFVLAPANPNRAAVLSAAGGSGGTLEIALAEIIVFALRTVLVIFPLMLGGLFFMAAVYGSSFGNFFTAVLKLAAMVLAIITLNDALVHGLDILTGGFGFIGIFIRLAVVIPVFFILSKLLFDMEEHETWTLFAIMIVGPIVVWMGVLVILMSYF